MNGMNKKFLFVVLACLVSSPVHGQVKYQEVGSAQDVYLGRVVNPGGHTNLPQTRNPASMLVVSHPDYRPTSMSLFDILGIDGTPPDEPILIKLAPK